MACGKNGAINSGPWYCPLLGPQWASAIRIPLLLCPCCNLLIIPNITPLYAALQRQTGLRTACLDAHCSFACHDSVLYIQYCKNICTFSTRPAGWVMWWRQQHRLKIHSSKLKHIYRLNLVYFLRCLNKDCGHFTCTANSSGMVWLFAGVFLEEILLWWFSRQVRNECSNGADVCYDPKHNGEHWEPQSLAGRCIGPLIISLSWRLVGLGRKKRAR